MKHYLFFYSLIALGLASGLEAGCPGGRCGRRAPVRRQTIQKPAPVPVQPAPAQQPKKVRFNAVDNFVKIHDNAVVLFSRTSCHYCPAVKRHCASLQPHYDTVQFLEIDLDNLDSNELTDQQYKTQYKFDSVPTVIYFKNGQEVLRHDEKGQKDMANNIKEQFGIIEVKSVAKKSQPNILVRFKNASTRRMQQAWNILLRWLWLRK